ncbi:MAG: inositol monophosphatase [Bacteroidia bacterium]|nr:inositol monophosphatase [Bacteroidia bacterium]MCO5254825.1 inositol monophosphatase [Bacteroidota bacterium]MCZ2130918.1 inositol monophosphatase [Bacteroidia bacterium]
MQLQEILKDVKSLVLETGSFIETEQKTFNAKATQIKSPNQLVSYVDLEAEKQLIHGLSTIFPEAGFIGEETNPENTTKKEYTWIIDPLDGTTNFVHGLPIYCISIGLVQNNHPVLGVIYEPNRKELFSSYRHGGAFLNSQRIVVTQTNQLSDTLLATGFPYYDFEKINAYLKVLDYLMKSTRGLRRMGSAAVDLAYTACGRFDGFFEYGLSPWDVAGGACIVNEAGGHVCDFKGKGDYLFGKEIIACNSHIYQQVIDLIKSNFHP